jgi:Dolichyl-phosphate-mannose-protein mannosyltransferase
LIRRLLRIRCLRRFRRASSQECRAKERRDPAEAWLSAPVGELWVRVKAQRHLPLATKGTVLVLLLTAAYMSVAIPDMGMSWDEHPQRSYGMWTLDWYASRNPSSLALTDQWWGMPYYGAFFDVIGGLLELVLGSANHIVLRHYLTAVFGVVGILYASRTAKALAGPTAGFFAALLLATSPRWTGHSMFNPKDIPFAGMHAAAIFYLVRIAQSLPWRWRAEAGSRECATGYEAASRSPVLWSLWAKFGLFAGLALGVRIGGLLPLCYLAALLGLWVMVVTWRSDDVRPLLAVGSRFTGGAVLSVLIAYAVGCAFWPKLLQDPIGHTRAALAVASNFPWDWPVLFQGALVPASQLPRSYLLTWFAITMPVTVAAGLFAALLFVRETCAASPFPSRMAWLVVLLATLFPPSYAIYTHAIVYDGMRQFLFLLPSICVFAGTGWMRIIDAAAKGGARTVALGALGLLALEPAAWLVRAHPWQYVYFSPLVGGLRGASWRYETDYWGLSLRQAVEWIRAHRTEFSDGPVFIDTNGPWRLVTPFLGADRMVRPRGNDEGNDEAHVFIDFYRRQAPGWHLAGRPLYVGSVYADQVPFFRILPGPLAGGRLAPGAAR